MKAEASSFRSLRTIFTMFATYWMRFSESKACYRLPSKQQVRQHGLYFNP